MKHLVYGFLPLLILCASPFVAKADVQADKAALLALEAQWDIAAVKGDIAAFDALYADGFVFTNAQGKVQTKAEVQSELKSGDLKYLAAKVDDLTVALYGDAAVVTGRWAGKFVLKGKTRNTLERFTSTYVRQQNGLWRLVATQTGNIK